MVIFFKPHLMCCIIGGIFLLYSNQAWAFTFKPGLAYTWWNYSEQDTIPARYGGGRVDSHAQNRALAPSLAISNNLGSWYLWANVESILTATGTEIFPNRQQQDRFSIKQWRAEMGSDYHVNRIGIGIWAAYQQQTQSRSQFYIRGTRVLVAGGEPVHETVTALLTGIRITATHQVPDAGSFLLYIKSGLPLRVKMKNSLPQITDTFHTRRGWEGEAGISWQNLHLFSNVSFELSALYRYRKLGGEAKASAYWPKNIWQRAQIMISISW